MALDSPGLNQRYPGRRLSVAEEALDDFAVEPGVVRAQRDVSGGLEQLSELIVIAVGSVHLDREVNDTPIFMNTAPGGDLID